MSKYTLDPKSNMGGDGGSIAKRGELVRVKPKELKANKDDARNARWFACTLSKLPLKEPIVACELGNLYNKEEIIKYLLDRSAYEGCVEARHVRKQKDVTTLRLTRNESSQAGRAVTAGAFLEGSQTQFQCPVTLLPMNGKYRFVFIKSCGCVFAEKALKELSSNSTGRAGADSTQDCLLCSMPYHPSTDVIPIYGEPDEVTALRARMEVARANEKETKKRPAKEATEDERSRKRAAPTGPSINPRINASAVVAMAEQELRQNRTGDVLKSILKSTSSKA